MDDIDEKIIKKINTNQNVPVGFTQSIQRALYKDVKIKNKVVEFTKILATACTTIAIAGGVSFAGYGLYQKIWKDPERISIEQAKQQLDEESQIQNITEEQAKEIAEQKLKEIGFTDEIIVETTDVPDQNKLLTSYCFRTNNKWIISVNAKTAKFESLIFGDYNKEWENYTITRKEAIEVAKDF